MDSERRRGIGQARRPLSRALVLEAAMAYVDAHGLAALSMHKLGAELGVKGMSLYNHVQGKNDLLNGIVELLWLEVEMDASTSNDWREGIRSLASSLRRAVQRHPNAAPLLMSRKLIPEATLRICDCLLQRMRDGGVPEQHAVTLLRTVFAYGFGYALAELSCFPTEFVTAGEDDELRRIRRLSVFLPSEVSDDLMRVALQMCCHGDAQAQHALGVELIIRGLEGCLGGPAR